MGGTDIRSVGEQIFGGTKYSLTPGSCLVGPDISVVQIQDVF